ncbi:eukaryotic translation initiation factor 3 subunit J-B [Sparus aurata]|nr:eukaryotic translation initiation factor 3 subunit J [Sparus aurata]
MPSSCQLTEVTQTTPDLWEAEVQKYTCDCPSRNFQDYHFKWPHQCRVASAVQSSGDVRKVGAVSRRGQRAAALTSLSLSNTTNTANMADWDAETFEPEEPIKKAAATAAAMVDKWEGEDEDEDVKDNWDDEDEDEEKKAGMTKSETKVSDKKKLMEKIKEKENRLKKKQQELKKAMDEKQEELTPEEQLAEKLRVKKLQEDADLELAKDAFGVSSTSNSVTGIDAMCPSSKEDFTEFEKLLKEKITQFEKSVHYSSFLDSLFRELCISLEVEDLKKVSNSLSVLLSEKQKQEKQNKGKKKKKGVVPGGGLKAQMRDDLDYATFDGGYAQDYEDFM